LNDTSTISLDRAQSIADAAVLAGLAQLPRNDADAYRYSPALLTKLAELEVDGLKLPAMTPEQADAVEAFITEQAGQ